MRQIGIACHNFHNDYGRLPPGTLANYPLNSGFTFNCQGVGMFAHILPYVEADHLYRQLVTTGGVPPNTDPPNRPGFDFGLTSLSYGWYSNATDRLLAGARVKYFTCPSDTVYEDVQYGTFIIMYCDGLTFWGGYYGNPTGNFFGRTNYVSLCGGFQTNDPFWGQWEGVMTNRGNLTLGQLTALDGTSNTVMIGELLGGRPSPRDFAITWMGGCAYPTAWGLAMGAEAQWYVLSSRHASVVQFCFGDCSIRGMRFLPRTYDPVVQDANWYANQWYVLMEVSGRQDAGQRDTGVILD
jgi:hypothetical protein